MRAATHTNVPVGIRDTPYQLANNPAVVADCDFVQADIYAYWNEVSVTNAAVWTIQQWQSLVAQYPETKVEIGEANWPTGGTNSGLAIRMWCRA